MDCIYPGDSKKVWNAETVTTGQASQQVALAPGRFEGEQRVSVEIGFSADPGAFTIDLQTADTDVAAAYCTEPTATITAVNAGFYARAEIAVKARFARLLMTAQPANAATVTAKISR